MRTTYGRFTVSVSDPSPCWVSVGIEGDGELRFTESALPDLIAACECAMRRLRVIALSFPSKEEGRRILARIGYAP